MLIKNIFKFTAFLQDKNNLLTNVNYIFHTKIKIVKDSTHLYLYIHTYIHT